MSAEDLKIVGICRFSYLATRGWNTTARDAPEITAETLYAPERMEERFNLFEAVCLPSIAAQTDQDFHFMILASHRMPEPDRARLESLVAPHPNVVIQSLRPRPMAEAVRVGLRRTVGRTNTVPVLQFCLDDDDAVSIHYVARLREMARGVLASPMAEKLPIAYTTPRGITLSKKGGVFAAHENFAPFLALGLAILTDGSVSTNPYVVPHLKTATRLFAMSDPEPMSYLRGLHDHHDSHGISKGRIHDLDEAALRDVLAAEFPFVTLETLQSVFGYAGDEVRVSGSSAG